MSARFQEQIYEDQENWISERFGEDAAKGANYGWGIDAIEGTISTKVYGHGVLTSTGPGEHVFESFLSAGWT